MGAGVLKDRRGKSVVYPAGVSEIKGGPPPIAENMDPLGDRGQGYKKTYFRTPCFWKGRPELNELCRILPNIAETRGDLFLYRQRKDD